MKIPMESRMKFLPPHAIKSDIKQNKIKNKKINKMEKNEIDTFFKIW